MIICHMEKIGRNARGAEKEQKNKDKIEEWFGYRDMGDGRYIPQSHCRDCRIEELGKQAD